GHGAVLRRGRLSHRRRRDPRHPAQPGRAPRFAGGGEAAMTADIGMLVVVAVLVATGVYLLMERSIVKMLLGLMLGTNGINLLLILAGGGAGDPPIIGSDGVVYDTDADPLAQAMILTAIVISMGLAAFVL